LGKALNGWERSLKAANRIVAVPKNALTLSLCATGSAVVSILALHGVKADLDPSWHMLSEYSIGANGWIMKAAFWLLALGNIALAFALQRFAANTTSKVGIALHYLVGITLVGAGLFDMDPMTSTPDQFTVHGRLHGVTGMIGIPGQVLAALVLAWGFTRSNQILQGSRKPLLLAATASLIALLLMAAYLVVAVPANGGFGPAVAAGWFNRLLVASFAGWLVTAAWQARSGAGDSP
jgi:hypothetical protein